jgi:DNA modification methylase
VVDGKGAGVIHVGDCLEVLRTLPSESVHCCVTSPPYWGLRDYGHDGQIGLEKSPEEYVAKMVAVFAEVRRVLRGDGTLWLNVGDSYNGSTMTGGNNGINIDGGESGFKVKRQFDKPKQETNLKPKDLCGIPWRLAFALQSDGWYLRQDIIWHKPNPMPESVRDRCTKAHEYVFLMSKSSRYYWDAGAVKEPAVCEGETRRFNTAKKAARCVTGKPSGNEHPNADPWLITSRNRRSVWTVATQPCKESHFAVMPQNLVDPCILAGCPEGGTVLDPFFGAGTVGLVAEDLGRKFIGIELNPEYAEIAKSRIDCSRHKTPLFSGAV